MLLSMILGSGYYAESNYGPMFVSFAIPLGAILFVIKRKSLTFSIIDINRNSIKNEEV